MLTMRIARAYAKGVEIGTFKPFDFEGVGELFRNFSETFPNFWGTFGELRVCGTGNPSPTMLFAAILRKSW